MTLPFVLSLPHCEGRIPEDLWPEYAFTDLEVEESTDVGTKEIFGSMPAIALVMAEWSRLVVDLNRPPESRGPKGVVAEVDYFGRFIYRNGRFPNENEIRRRLERYYQPFHERLKAAIHEPGVRAVFDCHSLYAIAPAGAPDAGSRRKDIVLGNNADPQGNACPGLGPATCPADTLLLVQEAFQDAGFSVAINSPYAGGFITTHYGKALAPEAKFALQVEINQALYFDPEGVGLVQEKTKKVGRRVLRVFEEIAMHI